LWPTAFLLPAGIVVGFFFYTLSVMLHFSVRPSLGPGLVGDDLTLGNYVGFLQSPFYLGFLIRSLWISLYCTAITAIFGYVIAYFMYRSSPSVRLVAGIILIVQFFTAYVIRTYAVMMVIGKTGIFNRALLDLGVIDVPLRLLYTEAGVAVGMVLVSLPFMVFPIFNSLQTLPRNLEMAAMSLGAGRLGTFWRVIFPLTMPGVAAGIVIVYLFELTSYIVPGALGGGYFDMMANLIYAKAMQSFDHPFAAAAAMVMLAVSLAAIYLLQKLFRLITPRQ
jgi:putative spermidine/putrescine transport system permease protein